MENHGIMITTPKIVYLKPPVFVNYVTSGRVNRNIVIKLHL